MTTTNARAWLALEGITTDHVDDETLIGLLRRALETVYRATPAALDARTATLAFLRWMYDDQIAVVLPDELDDVPGLSAEFREAFAAIVPKRSGDGEPPPSLEGYDPFQDARRKRHPRG